MNYINLKHSVHIIIIMLGFACNFNCKYCMQHEFKTDKMKVECNPEVIDFIKEQASINERININFFGGEPLLYFNTIKDIVLSLSKLDNISYNLITNGSLLNEETVNFINEHNIPVCISWDGRNTKLSRGIDVFETNKDNIFKLKNGFSVSSVLNAYNSPKTILEDVFELNKEYKKVYNTDIEYNIDNIYYLENSNSDIFLLDFEKYKNDVEELINKYIYDNKNTNYFEQKYVSDFMNMIKSYDENQILEFPACRNGINVLNIDLNGNLYLCHNNSDKVLGTIHSNSNDYYNKYEEYNNILPNYYLEHCKTCSVKYCCSKGCMLLSEDELKNFYCKQKKMLLSPILEKLIEYSKTL